MIIWKKKPREHKSRPFNKENAIVTAEWICGAFWDITGEEMVK